jgi:mitogen-activated protein kinase 1/3
MTRWYRAPEVIVLEPYDSKIDIWSVGCIFAEAMRCSIPQSKKNNASLKQRFLFTGSSCYPISPANSQDEHQVDINDQLIKITERFPKIKKDIDLSFISSPDSVEYMSQLMQRVEKQDPVSKIFPTSNPKLVALA